MPQFDSFVVFADMRTGSNFLEANINLFKGLQCHGEAFNPHFIGYPNSDDILGVTQSMRDENPARLINTVKEFSDGIGGFRFFNNHDPRAFDILLADQKCAKIVLTRNPVDSYISWKIAKATGQWKLTNVKHAKAEQVAFDAVEFENHMGALQDFQVRILNGLQRSGQTAFYIAYEDLQDVEAMNGMAKWLGCDDRIEGLDKKLKKQNPQPISQKVSDIDGMEAALAKMDRFNLSRTPNFEPRRGPAVPTYIAAPQSGLLYMPIRSGPEDIIRKWLADVDGQEQDTLIEGFNQKTLRQWKRGHAGHRSFSILRHPIARAHNVFCNKILPTEGGAFKDIRRTLRNQFNLPIPKDAPDDSYSRDDHHAAFLAFLGFLKSNLSAQTGIRVDGTWASQQSVLQGMADFGMPDIIIREDDMKRDLGALAEQIGVDAPKIAAQTDEHYDGLAAIYDEEIEQAGRAAFQRDYLAFGFENWA